MPPIAGLQDICAIRSRFIVTIAVRRPMRAQARAASQPGVAGADDHDVVALLHCYHCTVAMMKFW